MEAKGYKIPAKTHHSNWATGQKVIRDSAILATSAARQHHEAHTTVRQRSRGHLEGDKWVYEDDSQYTAEEKQAMDEYEVDVMMRDAEEELKRKHDPELEQAMINSLEVQSGGTREEARSSSWVPAGGLQTSRIPAENAQPPRPPPPSTQPPMHQGAPHPQSRHLDVRQQKAQPRTPEDQSRGNPKDRSQYWPDSRESYNQQWQQRSDPPRTRSEACDRERSQRRDRDWHQDEWDEQQRSYRRVCWDDEPSPSPHPQRDASRTVNWRDNHHAGINQQADDDDSWNHDGTRDQSPDGRKGYATYWRKRDAAERNYTERDTRPWSSQQRQVSADSWTSGATKEEGAQRFREYERRKAEKEWSNRDWKDDRRNRDWKDDRSRDRRR